eukprot:gene3847-13910_t
MTARVTAAHASGAGKVYSIARYRPSSPVSPRPPGSSPRSTNFSPMAQYNLCSMAMFVALASLMIMAPAEAQSGIFSALTSGIQNFAVGNGGLAASVGAAAGGAGAAAGKGGLATTPGVIAAGAAARGTATPGNTLAASLGLGQEVMATLGSLSAGSAVTSFTAAIAADLVPAQLTTIFSPMDSLAQSAESLRQSAEKLTASTQALGGLSGLLSSTQVGLPSLMNGAARLASLSGINRYTGTLGEMQTSLQGMTSLLSGWSAFDGAATNSISQIIGNFMNAAGSGTLGNMWST